MPAYKTSTVGGRDRKITGADQLPARLLPVGVPVSQNQVEHGRAGPLTFSSSLYICIHDSQVSYIYTHTPCRNSSLPQPSLKTDRLAFPK